MKDKHILVVMPEVPFPPRKNGLTLRTYPLLLRLSQQFQLTLAAVVGGPNVELGELRNNLHEFIPLHPEQPRFLLLRRILAQFLRLSPFGIPYDYVYYPASRLVDQLKPVLARDYDAVVWVTQDHILYACLPLLKKHRLIIDAVDSISLYIKRQLADGGLISRLRIAKTQRWEAFMINHAAIGFYISPVDLAAVKPLVHRVTLAVAPNGTLIDDYVTEKAPLQSPSLGFLGNMGYCPNIDAAHRLYRVYRALKQQVPDLALYIIGRNPDASLLRYAEDPDVHITGTLDNVWPYVNAVDVFVMPMAQGSGQQNKMLEVMYAGRPIVASGVANGGVQAVDGESIMIADDEAAMQEKILTLLENPALRERIAAGGARFVREMYDWDRIAGRFADAVRGEA